MKLHFFKIFPNECSRCGESTVPWLLYPTIYSTCRHEKTRAERKVGRCLCKGYLCKKLGCSIERGSISMYVAMMGYIGWWLGISYSSIFPLWVILRTWSESETVAAQNSLAIVVYCSRTSRRILSLELSAMWRFAEYEYKMRDWTCFIQHSSGLVWLAVVTS